MKKKRLLISFSGGRTSAFMMWWLLNKWPERNEWEIVVVFANTGLEDEGTLEFVDSCSKHWGINIVWAEAKHLNKDGKPFSEKGWKVSHQVVDFKSAARATMLDNGEFTWTPFEEMISVLGIPSAGNAPYCSKQMKQKAIKSYLKSIGWRGYYTAIGIRNDEVDRISSEWKKARLLYPLISFIPTIKSQVLKWFKEQPFDLNIHPDDGNCNNCLKKSIPHLVNNYRRASRNFLWWQKMTEKYGHINPRKVKLKPPFNFFRGNKSVDDIARMSLLTEVEINNEIKDKKYNNICSESCEAF